MDWYEALKAWQDGKLPADEAIRLADVADILELWELTLGSGMDIKLARGDRNHIAAVTRGHRQFQRGETVDINDLHLRDGPPPRRDVKIMTESGGGAR